MFETVMIANRGEIACRIIRTCRALGVRSVAVFSDADSEALHRRSADAAVHIGPPAARDSYLNIERILDAARQSGAQAIHPGYGFLSERSDFAQAVLDGGLAYIGPSPHAVAMMGDKAAAKEAMMRAGVPIVPGYQGDDQSDDNLIARALAIGLPVMIKAAAGGGGRGMRRVAIESGLRPALASARSEAQRSFGDGRLLIEKLIENARHVEVQVFGDSHGNVVHLGERECSIQRRHQKVIEETPSPAVDDALRQRMGAAAVAAAKAIDYVGAGTIEFLLAPDGQFYFMEMNTRLQVEHPVTEMTFGVDLVEWQLRVASGERLPLTQDRIAQSRNGWAIEARLCAEDPGRDFLPQVGVILRWQPAEGPGLRTDHGLVEGYRLTPYYDSLQAKLIAYGADREEARARLIELLNGTQLDGVRNNQAFLVEVLRHPAFVSGRLSTTFIADHFASASLRQPGSA